MTLRQCLRVCCAHRANLTAPLSSSSLRFLQYKPTVQYSVRLLSTASGNDPSHEPKRGRFTRFKIAMSQEEKARKKKEIEILRAEQAPEGLFAKCKFYFKRYWYIAVPVHCVCSLLWFSTAYIVVKSGIDIIALLQMLHIPESLIEKVKNTPQSAGVLVIALILYKIATPLRYATTLAGIQVTFWTLRRLGKLKTVKEVEYGVRSGYEKYQRAIHRLNERRFANVTSKPSRKKSNT